MDYSKLNNISASLQDVENATSIVENKLKDLIEQIERNAAISLNDLNDKCVQKDEDENVIILKKNEFDINNKEHINKKIKIRFIDDIDSFVPKYLKVVEAVQGEELTPETENEYKQELYGIQELYKLFIIDNNEYQNLIISKIYDSNNNLIDETNTEVPGLGVFSKESPIVANTDYYVNDFYTINENFINIFNLKKSGELYLFGVGNYSGESNNNSNEESESVQEVISNLENNFSNLESNLQNLNFKDNLKIDNQGNLVVHEIGTYETKTTTNSGFYLSNDYYLIYQALTYDPNSSVTTLFEDYTQEGMRQLLIQRNLINPDYYYYLVLEKDGGHGYLTNSEFFSPNNRNVNFLRFTSIKINETDVEFSDYIKKVNNDNALAYIVIGLETELSNISNVTMTYEYLPEFDKYIAKINLYNGNLYLPGIGNYTVYNPDYNISSVQEVLDNKLELTYNKSLVIGNNNTISKDSIAAGVGVNIIGDRSFGFGEAYTAIYLTGDSNIYTAKLFNKTNLNGMNKVADVFKTTHVNAYILETTNFTRVAKITAINWTDVNNSLTVTLDTNLGVLTDGQYCIENIGGAKTFSVGTFGNTGQYSAVFGNGNYNTGGYSLVSGYQNTNISVYSNVLGYWNKNAEAGANVMGYANKNTGQYPVVLGLENNNSGNYSVLLGKSNTNKCPSTNIVGSSNTVNETNYPSNILGMDNTVDANAQSFILGYSNHGTKGTYAPSNTSCTFMLGHDLTTSRGGIALGWYNKDYDVQTEGKQNFFVVGQGTANQPLNTIEQKANADLYIYGIGNFNGINSDNANVKTVQQVISNLQSTITSLESRIAALENQLNGGNS